MFFAVGIFMIFDELKKFEIFDHCKNFMSFFAFVRFINISSNLVFPQLCTATE